VLKPEAFNKNSGIMPRLIINPVYLQDANRMIVFTTRYEYGVINTINHQLEKVGAIGREGVRSAKTLASMFSPIMSDIFRVKYNLSMNNFNELHFIVGSKDEKFIYVLELTSNDITILDVEKGSNVDIIPVGLNYLGIILSPDGRYLWALSSVHVKAIDTETNKVHVDHQNNPDVGEIKGIRFIDSNNSAAILYNKTMQIWDTEKGTIIKEYRNLSSAEFLMYAKLE
jgi:DNA-binding beta-propeller fold protein YncE